MCCLLPWVMAKRQGTKEPGGEASWDSGGRVLRLQGPFTVRSGADPFPPPPGDPGDAALRVDGAGISQWDSLLVERLGGLADEAAGKGFSLEWQDLPAGVEDLLEERNRITAEARAAGAGPETPGEADPGAPPRKSLLQTVGRTTEEVAERELSLPLFLGQTVLSVGRLLRGRAVFQGRDFLEVLWECSGRALPIVLLISFLTGLIFAFIGATQLQRFGAEIFVPPLVSLAMFREMGALMTGIILSGRTGSAFAARIGSMKANDELNALQTMGVSPFDFIVLPRLLALVLLMPLLGFLASWAGVMGGFLMSVSFLGLTPATYVTQTAQSLDLANFLIGPVKSVVFGALIALIGCQQGMAAGASASSVGRAATSAVVQAITWIIVADALFAILMNLYGS